VRIAAHRGIHCYRRAIQIVFLAAFFVLLTLTVWPLGRLYLGVFLVADPLIATNSVVNGVWKPAMVLAVAMLAAPLLLGRAFCGYLCPMGTVVEMTGGKSRPSRLSSKTRARLRKAPAFVLIGSAGLLLFASGAFLLLDPLSTLTRSATVLLYPLLDRFVRLVTDGLYLLPPLGPGVDAVTSVLSGRIIFTHTLTYGLQLFALGLFAAVLGASWLEPRLWCRDFCPLGALLGQVGRFAPIARLVDEDACISCGKCVKACPLDAISEDFKATDTTRCQLGFECADICPTGAISFGRQPKKAHEGIGRRAFLGASAGALAVGFFGYVGLSHRTRNPRLIRPPGTGTNSEVLALCSRCGQCMKTCPTNVIQPSSSKAGLFGVFTPEMDYRTGQCEWSCNECGKVCPTGAIMPLELEVKRTTKIGRAYIDKNRCIPWSDGKTCLVCQELCPIPDKAIKISEAEVRTPEGETVQLGRPEVVAAKCIGCGVCEYNCPVPQESAIVVYTIESERRG
jgi:ferredoxin